MVTLPNRLLQYQKTSALRRILDKWLDQQGIEHTSFRWIVFIEGTGDAAKILRWHEWLDRVKERIENATIAQLAAYYESLTAEPYTGVQSKRAIVVKLTEAYFSINVPDSMTLAQIQTWMENHMPKLGRWGLGCPGNCGRFWEFRPTDTGFEPVDPAAVTGPQPAILEQSTDPQGTHYLVQYPDERGTIWQDTPPEPNRGYLKWLGTSFTCDRCGKVIILG